jgi:hypothetical protein
MYLSFAVGSIGSAQPSFVKDVIPIDRIQFAILLINTVSAANV